MLEALALAGPLLVVSGSRLFFGSDPSAMSAQVVPAAATPVPVSMKAATLTPEQQAAAAWITSVSALPDLASPMNHPVPAPRHVESPRPVEPTRIVPVASPVADLTLTGVLGNTSGGLAAINGKVYRIGDRVKPGLRLIAIDVKLNAIELQGDNGTVYRMIRELK
jgi:hypothetical protein